MSDPLPETVTFRDHTNASGTLELGADGHSPLPSSSPVSLPNPELLRTHAVLGSMLHMSGVVDLFVGLVYTLKRENVGSLPLPTPDGVSFWKDVIDPDGDMSRLDGFVQSFGGI